MAKIFDGLLGKTESALRGRDEQIKEQEEKAVNGNKKDKKKKEKKKENSSSSEHDSRTNQVVKSGRK